MRLTEVLNSKEDKKHRTKCSKRNLTSEERHRIYELLLESSVKGVLPYGVQSKLAAQFNVCIQTVSRIWKQANESLQTQPFIDIESKIKGNSGRKRDEVDISLIKNLDISERTSFSKVSKLTNISRRKLKRLAEDDILRMKIVQAKPLLTSQHHTKRRYRISKDVCFAFQCTESYQANPFRQESYSVKTQGLANHFGCKSSGFSMSKEDAVGIQFIVESQDYYTDSGSTGVGFQTLAII